MNLSALERWYLSRCNGEWEHSYGVSIETLDNPGWSVRFDLTGTAKELASFDRVKVERSDHDWIVYWVEEKQFRIACGPLNFSEAVEVFVQWFERE